MQQELFHDTFEDALRSVSDAVGTKQMAAELWPEKPVTDAARLLLHCLDPDRNEKLSAGQIALILKRGREAGVHIGIAYLTQTCGYADPQPLDPEDEKARLQREYIEATKTLDKITKRMGAL